MDELQESQQYLCLLLINPKGTRRNGSGQAIFLIWTKMGAWSLVIVKDSYLGVKQSAERSLSEHPATSHLHICRQTKNSEEKCNILLSLIKQSLGLSNFIVIHLFSFLTYSPKSKASCDNPKSHLTIGHGISPKYTKCSLKFQLNK